jgi:hypothetical protein
MSRGGRMFFYVAAGFIGLLGLAGLFGTAAQVTPGGASRSSSVPAKPSRTRQVAAATLACQEQVRARLKSPATAQFPPFPEVRGNEQGLAMVISHVDSQNSFGALLRTQWICEVDVSDPDRPNVKRVVFEK